MDSKEKQNPPGPQLSSEDEDKIFYNVMPGSGKESKLVQPAAKPAPPAASTPPAPAVPAVAPSTGGESLSFFAKYKSSILITIVAVLVIAAAYFGYSWYLKKNGTGSSIVLNTPPTSTKPSTTTPASNFPAVWMQKYFNTNTCQDPSLCGETADPDHDGLTNKEEFQIGTDPNNPDSDNDGLADGDEVHVFRTDPSKKSTVGDPKYNDADYLNGGYAITKESRKMTQAELDQITKNLGLYGLHQPTLKTLANSLQPIYHFGITPTSQQPSPTSTPVSASSTQATLLDNSAEAKQDRDAQRLNTIKNIAIALVLYQQDQKQLPNVTVFLDMFNQVKPFAKVAINPVDPVNISPFVYSYSLSTDGSDFTLSFYSETQNQLIKYHLADGKKFASQDQSQLYDSQRVTDLETIRSTLLLYSNSNIAGNQTYVFPPANKYQTDLVPNYISSIPKDPKTGQDYDYQVSASFDSFTLKAVLDAPPAGNTGYLCNQEECRYY